MKRTQLIGIGLIVVALILTSLLVYVKTSMDEQGVFMCEAVAANPDMEMEECPVHQSKTSLVIMLAFGIALVILALGVYLAIPWKADSPAKESKKQIDLSKLDEQERKIVLALQDRDGSMYQSDLAKELDLTKVQMTRLLDRLEAKKLVDRRRRGMTNIIMLK